MDRDAALGVKADVDGMLSGFGPVENSVSNLEDRLEDSLEARDSLSDQLRKVGTTPSHHNPGGLALS